jgi:hypothetical protein
MHELGFARRNVRPVPSMALRRDTPGGWAGKGMVPRMTRVPKTSPSFRVWANTDIPQTCMNDSESIKQVTTDEKSWVGTSLRFFLPWPLFLTEEVLADVYSAGVPLITEVE